MKGFQWNFTSVCVRSRRCVANNSQVVISKVKVTLLLWTFQCIFRVRSVTFEPDMGFQWNLTGVCVRSRRCVTNKPWVLISKVKVTLLLFSVPIYCPLCIFWTRKGISMKLDWCVCVRSRWCVVNKPRVLISKVKVTLLLWSFQCLFRVRSVTFEQAKWFQWNLTGVCVRSRHEQSWASKGTSKPILLTQLDCRRAYFAPLGDALVKHLHNAEISLLLRFRLFTCVFDAKRTLSGLLHTIP